MDSEITTRQYQRDPAANEEEVAPHWPTLLGRMLEDVSRVIELELKLLEARIAPALITMAERAIAGLVILSAGIIAGACLLTALIMLLHEWMPWWQCFGIGGLVAIVCGLIAYASVRSSTAHARP